MDTKQLWKISKFVKDEAFFIGQIESAGSNREKILEKLEKNNRYIRTQSIAINVVTIIYIIFAVVIPYQVFNLSAEAIESGIEPSWVLFLGSIFIALFFLMQYSLLVVFQMFFSMGLLSDDSFKWLQTLPLSRSEIEKIIIYALFRGIRWLLLTCTIVLPIAIAIVTKSFLLTFVALIISILNLVFIFSSLVAIGARLKNMFDFQDEGNSKKTIVRIVAYVIYFVLVMGVMLGIQMLIPLIPEYLSRSPAFDAEILNNILPIIPFPFTGSYLLMYLGTDLSLIIDNLLIIILGILILGVVLVRLYKNTKKKLFEIISGRATKNAIISIVKLEDVKVEVVSPKVAYFRKDKNAAKRDMQMIAFLIIPFVYAFLAHFLETDMGEDITINPTVPLYIIISGGLLAIGSLNINNSGSTILASLPTTVRDQAITAMKWPILILPAAFLLPYPFLLTKPDIGARLVADIVMIGWGLVFSLLSLEFKVYLFGKLKHKYVLEDVVVEKKLLKWIIFGIVSIGLIILITAVYVILGDYPLIEFLLYMVGIGLGLALIVYYIFNKMFPKDKIYEEF